MKETLLSLKNVSKAFDDKTVLNSLDLDILDGEFITLLGPSGCGKTTLLRIVAGLENPSSGEILIDGKSIIQVPPKKRDIAMVFQNYALYPHKKVFDNLAFCLQLRKLPRAQIKEKVQKTAELLGIDNLLQRYPNELSGGQKQRAALGRAIIRNPKVFLFDEPLSNLDAKLRVSMRTELMDLHQRLKTTSIYVTHDQMEAMTMATRIAVMKDGILQQIDSPQQLYDHPTNVFVAGFIGSPSMNFFDATMVESDGKLEINAGGFRLVVPDEKAKEWRQHKGREVIFGIRPEDIHSKQFTPPDILESDVTAKVDVTELMGNEIFLYLLTRDKKQFIARVDPRVRTTIGDDIDLAINMANAHIFDPKTEMALDLL